MMSNYMCIDIEASGLHANCYPIEIAIADPASDFERSWLICPIDAWCESGVWEEKAEALHGITRVELVRNGLPPKLVVSEFLQCVEGNRIVSDCPAFDERWFQQLATAADHKMNLVIDDLEDVAYRIMWGRSMNHEIALKQALSHAHAVSPKTHRALPDARHNAAILKRLLTEPSVPGGV